jgi:hypothetical protein
MSVGVPGKIFSALVLGITLAGCAQEEFPVQRRNDPDSPLAPESLTTPTQPALQPDQATERTKKLLALRAQEDATKSQSEQSPLPQP